MFRPRAYLSFLVPNAFVHSHHPLSSLESLIHPSFSTHSSVGLRPPYSPRAQPTPPHILALDFAHDAGEVEWRALTRGQSAMTQEHYIDR